MGLLTLDKSNYSVYKGQQLLDIDQNEFGVLWVLSSHPGHIFSEEDIALELVDEYYDFKGFSLKQIINNLQQKLSFQNIQLMNKDGFKIEFQQVFR